MISIIIPFHNEKESLYILINQISEVCTKSSLDFEIILVDDGSNDGGILQVNNKSLKHNIILLQHRKRLGKGKALQTGFKKSKGDFILFMDADLQDDPNDIPFFIEKLKKGYDLVNGWRKNRIDPLSKKIPSTIFNTYILKFFFRLKIHDINCGFKAMKREVLNVIPMYGDNYRFLPIMAEQEGFKTTEVVVTHHSRKYGKSKYGFFRLFFGLMDTVSTYFVYRFSEKPLHFFGPIGIALFSFGMGIMIYLTIERIFYHMLLYRRPVLLYGILFIIVGIQVALTGIIGELIVYLDKKKNI